MNQQDMKTLAVMRKVLLAEGMSDKEATDMAKILLSALNAAPKEDLRK